MKIAILDAETLGADLSLAPLEMIGQCHVYASTKPDQVAERLEGCDVAVLNKIKLNESNLSDAKQLKLICVAATGYDNIDVAYCRKHNIAVCNVEGYSSHSVAQITVSMVLALSVHLTEYTEYVKNGSYTESGVANRLTPVYHEICGGTWGIEALGCRLLVCKRTPVDGYKCTDIDTLCRESDIITIHTPLNDGTRNLINKERLSVMKKNVILVNVARGAVTDEAAVAEAVVNGDIGAFGTDVYSVEPFDKEHPFNSIKNYPNVILTPHMAWGAYEARKRCLDEIVANIKDFFTGGTKGRVDLVN